MSNLTLLNEIAATDRTFQRVGDQWIGKCLICRAPMRFDAGNGEGATVEHILPRTAGGSNDLHNLGLAHPACNWEKGRNWDSKKASRRRADPQKYAALVDRLLLERQQRWRDPLSLAAILAIARRSYHTYRAQW